MGSSLSKPMMVGLLLCLVYYAFACWISYGQLGAALTLWSAILFGSGFAGLEVSIWLLMPFSKDVKKILGFILGLNGAISAMGWLIHVRSLFFFILGLVQFFYFSCFSIRNLAEVDSKRHGS